MIVHHRVGLTIHAVDMGSPSVSLCFKRLVGGQRVSRRLPVTCSGCQEALARPRFAFCENVTASAISPIHIRLLTGSGLKPSGGADTMALCGHPVAWDCPGVVNEATLADSRTCRRCRDLWDQTVRLTS